MRRPRDERREVERELLTRTLVDEAAADDPGPTWTMKSGKEVLVREMDRGHLANTILYVRKTIAESGKISALASATRARKKKLAQLEEEMARRGLDVERVAEEERWISAYLLSSGGDVANLDLLPPESRVDARNKALAAVRDNRAATRPEAAAIARALAVEADGFAVTCGGCGSPAFWGMHPKLSTPSSKVYMLVDERPRFHLRPDGGPCEISGDRQGELALERAT